MAALSAVANTLYSEAVAATTEHKETDEGLLIRRA